jgi:tRNA threonylcarbamoyladenosine modification (KEOPS) complex Cgi121 subunit
MEIILYAAGERQLKLAIPKIGFKKGEVNIVALFYSEKNKLDLDLVINNFLKEFDLKKDNKVLKGDVNTLKKFGITDSEIKTVSEERYGDLILEKVAMVDIIK